MEISDITRHARALYDAHGDAAEAEAAARARAATDRGDPDQAETWIRIRAAIRGLRGALAS